MKMIGAQLGKVGAQLKRNIKWRGKGNIDGCHRGSRQYR